MCGREDDLWLLLVCRGQRGRVRGRHAHSLRQLGCCLVSACQWLLLLLRLLPCLHGTAARRNILTRRGRGVARVLLLPLPACRAPQRPRRTDRLACRLLQLCPLLLWAWR